MRPHRRQPTRPRRPWDSPGKNTGVGCHFLLQCVKVKNESEVARSCPILKSLWFMVPCLLYIRFIICFYLSSHHRHHLYLYLYLWLSICICDRITFPIWFFFHKVSLALCGPYSSVCNLEQACWISPKWNPSPEVWDCSDFVDPIWAAVLWCKVTLTMRVE